MIAGKQYDIVLAYEEIFKLEEYLCSVGKRLGIVTSGASYSASCNGVTIRFGSEKQRDAVVNFVLTATDEQEEE